MDRLVVYEDYESPGQGRGDANSNFTVSFRQVVSASIVAPKSRYYPPKMYGFVTMKTEKEAELCIRELNLREVKGQKLLIEIVSRHPLL